MGHEAYVSPDSYFDRDSAAEGRTRVCSAAVTRSAVRDSTVSAAHLADCLLDDCIVVAHLGHAPTLRGVNLRGVRVEGEVFMGGAWEMDCPGAWVHAGSWHRAPRALCVAGENGVRLAVVECERGLAHFGCKCRPVLYWLTRGPAVGRRLGWTEAQIEAASLFLEGLKR